MVTPERNLGEVQSSYSNWLSAVHSYRNYRLINYYPKKIQAVSKRKQKTERYYKLLKKQMEISEEQTRLTKQQYERDSLLYVQHVISAYELENSRHAYLQSQSTLEMSNRALENERIQIAQLEENLLDMELEQSEKEIVLRQEIHRYTEELFSAIQGWKLTYCLYAPIAGKVAYASYWNENQFVHAGDTVCMVVPENREKIFGRSRLPLARSGKVAKGQQVIVRFINFPDEEYGRVEGIVEDISLIPSFDSYQVSISFPNGLTTNYGKTLPLQYEMTATAEIVTADLTILERLVQPFRKIIYEGRK